MKDHEREEVRKALKSILGQIEAHQGDQWKKNLSEQDIHALKYVLKETEIIDPTLEPVQMPEVESPKQRFTKWWDNR